MGHGTRQPSSDGKAALLRRASIRWGWEAAKTRLPDQEKEKRALHVLNNNEEVAAKRLREESLDASRGSTKKKRAKRRKAKQAKTKIDARATKVKVGEALEGPSTSKIGRVEEVTRSPIEDSPHSRKVEGGGDGGESQVAPSAREETHGRETKGDGDARVHSADPTPTLIDDYSYLYGDEMEKGVATGVGCVGEGRIDPEYERDHEVARPLSEEIVEKTMHIPDIQCHVEAPRTPYRDEEALVADEAWEVFLREAQDMVDPNARSIWVAVE